MTYIIIASYAIADFKLGNMPLLSHAILICEPEHYNWFAVKCFSYVVNC